MSATLDRLDEWAEEAGYDATHEPRLEEAATALATQADRVLALIAVARAAGDHLEPGDGFLSQHPGYKCPLCAALAALDAGGQS